ncbi:MAG: hypothetical protein HONBIEJF_02911 [Fimbriimonadaceae bacterium]|nr:hypothetical protein [Fimbriimonadaceae bacterium]
MSKYRVNGVETEFPKDVEATISPLSDRLMVRTADGAHSAVVARTGDKTLVSYQGRVYEIQKASLAGAGPTASGNGEALAPMPGLIVDVLVGNGEAVTKGQKLLILEAMKTQQPVSAPFDGVVENLGVAKGDQVVEGQLLVKVKPA